MTTDNESALAALLDMRRINFADTEHGKSYGAGFHMALDELWFRLTGTHVDSCEEHEYMNPDCEKCTTGLGIELARQAALATQPATEAVCAESLHRVTYNEDGTIDEVVTCGAYVHLEQMDDHSYYLVVDDKDAHQLVWIQSASGRAKVKAVNMERTKPIRRKPPSPTLCRCGHNEPSHGDCSWTKCDCTAFQPAEGAETESDEK